MTDQIRSKKPENDEWRKMINARELRNGEKI